MYLLVLSLLFLYTGPFIYELFIKQNAEKKIAYLKIIDGFVFVSITGLLLEHIVPHIYEEANPWLFIFLLLGFLGPNILESNLLKAAKSVHAISLLLALSGLLIHSVFDGAGLALGALGKLGALADNDYSKYNLPIALIIHNLPVGLTVWWLLVPPYGRKSALTLISAMSIATIIGFFATNNINLYKDHDFFHSFEAFFIGSLLHVVFFRVHIDGLSCCGHSHADEGERIVPTKNKTSKSFAPEFLGNILAMIFLYLIFFHKNFSSIEISILKTFINLAYQTAPALCLAYICAGVLHAFMPNSSIQWLKKGSRLTQASKGLIFGLPLPICSCGVLPLYASLIDKKVPQAAAIAFLIATPEIGLDAFLVSLPLLGFELSMLRLISAAILAFSLAMIFSSKSNKAASRGFQVLAEKEKFSERLKKSLNYGLVTLVDTTGPWIVLGLLVAAVCEPFLKLIPYDLPYNIDVLAMSLIGIVVYVCATGATPFVAILVSSGLSPGAAIAFLLTGPATNVSSFGVLKKLHGAKFSLAFAICTAIGAILIGIGVNEFSAIITKVNLTEVLHHHEIEAYKKISLFIVGLLFIYSISRRGFRAFLSEII